MPSTPRTPAPDRPPPPVPPPPIHPPPPDPSPSPPGEEYHTPTPSFDASPPEEGGSAHDNGTTIANDSTAVSPKSPQLSPIRRFPSPNLLPPPTSPTESNGQDRRDATATPSPAGRVRPQLRLAKGLVRTPSQGSTAAKSPTPSPSPPSPLTPAPASKSPSPSPPSPLTPAPAAKSPSSSPASPLTPGPTAKSPSLSPPSPLTPAPTVNIIKSNHGTPKRGAEAWKPLSPPPPPPPIDQKEEAATSPLYDGKPRLDQARRPPAAAENGGGAAAVPPDVAAVARVGERRVTSVALRLATAVLSLAAFSVMVSARTTGWAGDSYGRYVQYRYAVGVNVIVCAYSIAQCFGEIRRLVSPRFIFRSMSSYYFSLFLDQVLAYLLMSASSVAASRNDLWVTRFGTDPFNKKINSALWLSFVAFLTLAANALISTANLFSML
ncbi:hypothetical protein QOZ80_1BG0076470 [Eleusine coracana subsp. coracana]|nr:hypothetical protein QOZ80_1BG0076470 [Eleusine coracana subsp. coracana]